MPSHLHRNSQKRIYLDGAIYFITTVTHKRFPYFQELLLCELFVHDLRFAESIRHFVLHGYVVLPDHVHLLIEPQGEFNISTIMHNIKRNFSHNANIVMGFIDLENNLSPNEGEDDYLRLRNRHLQKTEEPYYHQLPNWDFLKRLREQFLTKYSTPSLEFSVFKWQRSFRDHIIRSPRDYANHLQYIHDNPAKHGVVQDPEEYLWMWCEGMIAPEPNIEYN